MAGISPQEIPFATPLLGRAPELEWLDAAFERAGRGAPQLVVLSGEAGVGKTRLASEFASSVDACVLGARAWRDSAQSPLLPWISLLGDLLVRADSEATEGLSIAASDLRALADEMPLLGALAPAGPLPGRAEIPVAQDGVMAASAQPIVLFERLRRIFRALSGERALVFLLDDFQWADPLSLDLLRYLSAGEEGRILLLMMARPVCGAEEAAEFALAGQFASTVRVAEVLEVGPLPVEAQETLVAASGADAATRAEWLRVCGGNAFFLTELLRLHAAAPTGGAAGDRIPASVLDMVAEHAAILDPAERESLGAAAVVGDPFTLDTVAAVLGGSAESWSPLFRAVDAFLACGFIERSADDPMAFGFRHALVAETLAHGVSIERRAGWHRRMAELLEGQVAQGRSVSPAKLARHWRLAGPGADAARVREWSARAGRLALGQQDLRSALAHLERALPAAEVDAAERGRLLVDLGNAQLQLGAFSDAQSTLAEAFALAEQRDDPKLLRSALLAQQGWFAFNAPGSVSRERIAQLEHVLDADDQQLDASERLRLKGALADQLAKAGEHERAGVLAGEIRELARDPRIDPASRATGWIHAAVLGWHPGRLGERMEWLQQARRIAEEAGDMLLAQFAALLMTTPLLARGEMEAFARARREAHQFAERTDIALWRWASAWLEATEAGHAGRLSEVAEASERAFREGQAVEPQTALVSYAGQMQSVWRACGQQDRLIALMQMAPRYEKTPAVGIAMNAAFAAEMGDLEDARAELARIGVEGVARIPQDIVRDTTMDLLVDAVARVDWPEFAAALYGEILPVAGQIGVGGWSALSLGAMDRHLGVLAARGGDLDQAARHFEAATKVHERTGAFFAQARTWLDHGRAELSREGRLAQVRAVELLELARDRFDGMGATFFVEEAEALLGPATAALSREVNRPRAGAGPRVSLREDGRLLVIDVDGRAVRLRASLGLRYLRHLVERAGESLHVLELTALCASQTGGAPERFQQLRDRLAALADAKSEAEAQGESSRFSRLLEEEERVRGEFVVLTGAGSPGVERARKAVANRLRFALRALGEHDPEIAGFFRRALTTGTYCRYLAP